MSPWVISVTQYTVDSVGSHTRATRSLYTQRYRHRGQSHLFRNNVGDYAIVVDDLPFNGCFAFKGDRSVQIQSDLALGEHPHPPCALPASQTCTENALADSRPRVKCEVGTRQCTAKSAEALRNVSSHVTCLAQHANGGRCSAASERLAAATEASQSKQRVAWSVHRVD